MSFLKRKVTQESITETQGSSYIAKSGIYDVALSFVSVDQNDHGAHALNFNVKEENGNETTFYGLKLENNDGTPNYQAEIFDRLCVIAGLVDDEGNITVNDPEEQVHKLGKDKVDTKLAVLDDFTDLEVKIRVQEEYSKYNDKIRKRMVIKGFYRAGDGAAAIEIANGENFGEQIKKDEKYATNVTYKDGLTPDDIEAWREAAKKGSDAPKAPQAAVKNKSTGSLFKY